MNSGGRIKWYHLRYDGTEIADGEDRNQWYAVAPRMIDDPDEGYIPLIFDKSRNCYYISFEHSTAYIPTILVSPDAGSSNLIYPNINSKLFVESLAADDYTILGIFDELPAEERAKYCTSVVIIPCIKYLGTKYDKFPMKFNPII